MIQLPNAPFGLSWYQGDMESNADGRAVGDFSQPFQPGDVHRGLPAGAAPMCTIGHRSRMPINPATAPVHTFHLGLWFGSPDVRRSRRCPNNVTPFNGDHTAASRC